MNACEAWMACRPHVLCTERTLSTARIFTKGMGLLTPGSSWGTRGTQVLLVITLFCSILTVKPGLPVHMWALEAVLPVRPCNAPLHSVSSHGTEGPQDSDAAYT